MEKKIKFSLGGTDKGIHGWKTVNLVPGVDIQADFLNVDSYCEDNSVDAFNMVHTYEHISLVKLGGFLESILLKLKEGGKLIVIQTDVKKVLNLYFNQALDFYCLRDIVFTPLARQEQSYQQTGRMHLQAHKYMWGAEELQEELLHYGFSKTTTFDAGHWYFDLDSTFSFQENEKYFGLKIPNLGVEAIK